MGASEEMKPITAQEKILEALDKRPHQIEELVMAAGVSRPQVKKVLKVLRDKGVISSTQNEHHGGRGRAMITYHLTGEEETIDWTPDLPYKGPSYTHFLQDIWKQPIGVSNG